MFHLASQQLHYGGFPRGSGISKQLEGKKHTVLCIIEMCHSIMGSHCKGQSSTWLGQELLLSDMVQLIWGPHLPPPPKDRILSCARTTAVSLWVFWDSA